MCITDNRLAIRCSLCQIVNLISKLLKFKKKPKFNRKH